MVFEYKQNDLLANLNDMQRQVVVQKDGPVLVLAGAGSGKTSALTARIAYMIEEYGINPWNILAVTFTNKAANEMKERVLKLIKKSDKENLLPNIGTFHASCVRILRQQIHKLGQDENFIIYDTADQQTLMKHILEELLIDPKKYHPKAILNFISGAKNELITPEKYIKFANNYFTEKVAQCYKKYQLILKKNNAIDFDDIIMKTVDLFTQFPDILDFFQEKYRYILIDEYQDTNHAQYVLTNLLAKKYRNLCVIGDSDQSIYAFRGANIDNILNFEKDYPDSKVVYLEQNYRSTRVILDAAHSVIIKNTRRKDKKLWTEREGGENITLKTVSDEIEEGKFVAKTILEYLSEGKQMDFKKFVVLYRTNAQSRALEEVFLKYKIPYKIVGGIKFYERKEIKDIVAYLRVIQNPNDSISLLRIINTPARKIGAKTIEIIQQYAIANEMSFWEALNEKEHIKKLGNSKNIALDNFTDLIKKLRRINQEFSASAVIKHVLELSGYEKFLNDGTVEGESRLQNAHELISVASKYGNLDPGESLSMFLEEISLIADIDKLDEVENSVTMMTVHSAKGLEFSTVFLIGMEDGIFPHSRSLLEQDELEEERRLMYVAITRAKDKLFILHALNRTLYGESHTNSPSRFISDIPEELLENEESKTKSSKYSNLEFDEDGPRLVREEVIFSDENQLFEGDRINHETFGNGRVISIKGGVATITFDSSHYGTKKLALSIAPLKKID